MNNDTKILIARFDKYVNHYIVPTIAAIGIIGNLFTVAVFTRRGFRKGKQLQVIDRAYLFTIAIVDLFFLMLTFLIFFSHGKLCQRMNFKVFYALYAPGIINTFLLTRNQKK